MRLFVHLLKLHLSLTQRSYCWGLFRANVGLVALLGLLGGCASASQFSSFTVLQVANPDRDAVMEAATDILSKFGYTLEHVEASSTATGTRLLSTADDAEKVGLSRTQSAIERFRLLANVRVFQSSDACQIYCRVSLQQQSTEAHRLFSSNYSSTDVPTGTPIDREAATTFSQNTVWSNVRRIRQAEQELLQAVNSHLSRSEK